MRWSLMRAAAARCDGACGRSAWRPGLAQPRRGRVRSAKETETSQSPPLTGHRGESTAVESTASRAAAPRRADVLRGPDLSGCRSVDAPEIEVPCHRKTNYAAHCIQRPVFRVYSRAWYCSMITTHAGSPWTGAHHGGPAAAAPLGLHRRLRRVAGPGSNPPKHPQRPRCKRWPAASADTPRAVAPPRQPPARAWPRLTSPPRSARLLPESSHADSGLARLMRDPCRPRRRRC